MKKLIILMLVTVLVESFAGTVLSEGVVVEQGTSSFYGHVLIDES